MNSAELNELIRTKEACNTVMGWLKGERSMCNSFGSDDEAHARLAEADAGCTQQAYWTVKAYKEGLIKAQKPREDSDACLQAYDEG